MADFGRRSRVAPWPGVVERRALCFEGRGQRGHSSCGGGHSHAHMRVFPPHLVHPSPVDRTLPPDSQAKRWRVSSSDPHHPHRYRYRLPTAHTTAAVSTNALHARPRIGRALVSHTFGSSNRLLLRASTARPSFCWRHRSHPTSFFLHTDSDVHVSTTPALPSYDVRHHQLERVIMHLQRLDNRAEGLHKAHDFPVLKCFVLFLLLKVQK